MRAIAVVEPQMTGVFHAPFNAALLHTVLLAFEGTPVSFAAEPGHLHEVREILAEHAPEMLERVGWRELPVAAGESLVTRWLRQRRLLRHVLARGERLLFSSISRMQLLQLQGLMRADDDVRAVLHGDLERIAHAPNERFPASLFSLHRALLRRQPTELRYVLLGASIRENIPAAFEAAFHDAAVIDHPYHFRPLSGHDAGAPVFGVFGNAGDGRVLEAAARGINMAAPETRLRMVGFVGDKEAVARLQPYVEDVTTQPLTREEFAARAESLTHALWLAGEDSSRLRASGTFFDALSYTTPLIFTANAFLDQYHAIEPGIGIRCTGPSSVAKAVVEAVRTQTPDQYAAAQQAMLRLRDRFTPQAQARGLAAALGWK